MLERFQFNWKRVTLLKVKMFHSATSICHPMQRITNPDREASQVKQFEMIPKMATLEINSFFAIFHQFNKRFGEDFLVFGVLFLLFFFVFIEFFEIKRTASKRIS